MVSRHKGRLAAGPGPWSLVPSPGLPSPVVPGPRRGPGLHGPTQEDKTRFRAFHEDLSNIPRALRTGDLGLQPLIHH